jgi:hypothetical protein
MGIIIQWEQEDNNANYYIVAALKILVLVMGIVVARVGWITIKAAYLACACLKEKWEETRKLYDAPLPVVPPLTGGGDKTAEKWGARLV